MRERVNARRRANLDRSRSVAGRDFEELEVYQAARDLRKAIYDLTETLPPDERFGLIQQMKRAAVSLTNNIAEGHGTYTFRHTIAFLHRARGSVYELRDDLNVCEDEDYVPLEKLEELRPMAVRTTQLIDGYVRYLRKRDAKADRPGA